MFFLIIGNIILVILLIISIYYLIQMIKNSKAQSKTIEDLREQVTSIRSTDILKEILKVSFEKEALEISSNKLIKLLLTEYDIDFCSLLLMENNKFKVCSSNIRIEKTLKDIEDISLKIDKELTSASGKQIHVENGYLPYESAVKRKINFCFYIPLKNADNTTLGAVYVEKSNYNVENTDLNLDFFKIVLDAVLLSFQNLIYYDKIVFSATRDPLTKMLNRREMDRVLNNYIKSQTPFSLAMMDIDHFKKFNDTYGHSFGDLVLVEVSGFIKRTIPSDCDIFRYGGEEFLIVFPNRKIEDSFTLLDEIREGISNLVLKNEQYTASVKASFGISQYTSGFTKVDDLKVNADKALYESKENGRNRVTIYK